MLLPIVGEVSILVLVAACCTTWCLCQCVAAAMVRSKPWPKFQGNVRSISSMAEWSALLKRAGDDNRCFVLVDCFAYWCPPCKAAASIYAQMSLEYKDVLFAKVDVDAAGDVAKLLEVSAMPSFFLFGRAESHEPKYKCVDKCVGWSESRVRHMLELRGVQRVHVDLKDVQQHSGGGGLSDEERRSLIASQA